MTAPTSSSTGYFQRNQSVRAPLEFSFTFDSPQAVLRRSESYKGPLRSLAPVLTCNYCGGLYGRGVAFNDKQDSHNFICIHCTKRVEAEVEDTNHCQGFTEANDQHSPKLFPPSISTEHSYYQESLAEIKKSLRLLEKMLSEGDANCRTQLATLANEIEGIKQKLKQSANPPVVSTAERSGSAVECSSIMIEPENAYSGPKSSPVRFRTKSRTNQINRRRSVGLSDQSRKKYVHVVGGSKVGELEGFLNPLLNNDRRCRFFVYRRAAFRTIVNKVRSRLRLHNPKTNEQLIVLFAGPYDVLPLSSDNDLKDIWNRVELPLDALVDDCRRKGVNLIIYTPPPVMGDAEIHYQKVYEYVNSALHRKFFGTQVIVRDFSAIQMEIFRSQLKGSLPHCNARFSEAQQIAWDIGNFLGKNINELQSPLKETLVPNAHPQMRLLSGTRHGCRKPFFHQAFRLPFPPPRLRRPPRAGSGSIRGRVDHHLPKGQKGRPRAKLFCSPLSDESRHRLYLREY